MNTEKILYLQYYLYTIYNKSKEYYLTNSLNSVYYMTALKRLKFHQDTQKEP